MFCDALEEHGCTSFAGIPNSYELLRRTGWERRRLPTLRTMTQAGGRMAPPLVRAFAGALRDRGAPLVVMYGATEATARMCWSTGGPTVMKRFAGSVARSPSRDVVSPHVLVASTR